MTDLPYRNREYYGIPTAALGSGTYGNVRKHFTKDHGFVAIKEYKLKEEHSFYSSDCLVEISVMRKFSHPNIMKILDIISLEFGKLEVVMPCYVENLDAMASRMHREKTMQSQEFTLKMIKDTLTAVSYLHDHGVIHGDLSLSNVMVDKDNNCVVTDFGISKLGCNADLMRCTLVAIDFRPPELMFGMEVFNKKIDVYSLAMIYFNFCYCIAMNEYFLGQDRSQHTINQILAEFLGRMTFDHWPGLATSFHYRGCLDAVVNKHREGSAIQLLRMCFINNSKLQKIVYDMLTPNPQHRPSIRDVLNNDYFNDQVKDSGLVSVEPRFLGATSQLPKDHRFILYARMAKWLNMKDVGMSLKSYFQARMMIDQLLDLIPDITIDNMYRYGAVCYLILSQINYETFLLIDPEVKIDYRTLATPYHIALKFLNFNTYYKTPFDYFHHHGIETNKNFMNKKYRMILIELVNRAVTTCLDGDYEELTAQVINDYCDALHPATMIYPNLSYDSYIKMFGIFFNDAYQFRMQFKLSIQPHEHNKNTLARLPIVNRWFSYNIKTFYDQHYEFYEKTNPMALNSIEALGGLNGQAPISNFEVRTIDNSTVVATFGPFDVPLLKMDFMETICCHIIARSIVPVVLDVCDLKFKVGLIPIHA